MAKVVPQIRITDPTKDLAKINDAFARLSELDNLVQKLIQQNKLKLK